MIPSRSVGKGGQQQQTQIIKGSCVPRYLITSWVLSS